MIGGVIVKTNRWLLALLIFPLLMAILPVIPPCTPTIIARGAPLLLIIVMGHGGCCKIFGIWNNRLLGNPFWKLIWGGLGWVPTEPFTFNLQYFLRWPFLPQLWQVIHDLADDRPTDPLPFPLRRLLKSTWSKALLINYSIATVYSFGSESSYLDFYLLIAGSLHFESTRSRYYHIDSCARGS